MAEESGHAHGELELPREDEGRAGWDRFAADVVASHAPPWTASGGVVQLGPTGIEVRVHVEAVKDAAGATAATLHFDVGGPAVGPPALSTFSGYGASGLAAVVEGCCLWSQVFVPVLLAGYGGPAASATVADQPLLQDVETFAIDVDGRRHLVTVGSLGRTMSTGDGGHGDPQALIDATRTKLSAGASSLSEVVLAHASLPTLAPDRPTLLSSFVGDQANGRTTEVKVNGGDWPTASTVFDERPPGRDGIIVLIRELAVVSPARPSTDFPTREALQRTLDGLALRGWPAGSVASWPGWVAHGGRLAVPTAPDPGLGDLPPDYVTLLQIVGAGGAGPGYGLEVPRLVDDVIPLAFAGCGCTWLLRLDAAHRGEVWYDASGSDETSGFVAPSATAWYQLWLDAAVRGREPWLQWDVRACAPMGVLAQMLEDPGLAEYRERHDFSGRIKPNGLAINGGGPYLSGGPQPADPCQGCVAVFASWGLGPDVFLPGVLAQRTVSRGEAPPPDPGQRRRLFRRR